ncbi:MAG: hypothetical protein AAGF90_23445 [Pseudomonadota bacterium]
MAAYDAMVPNGDAKKAVKATDPAADLVDQLQALKTDFNGLAKAVSALATDRADAVKGEATATAQRVADTGTAMAEDAAAAAMRQSDALIEYARRKPMVALAAAAGVGLLIGFATAPRK